MFVIYYHNVLASPLDEFDRRLSRIHVDDFQREMRYLAANFHPLSLDAMLDQLRAPEPDTLGVVVTFDDGYYGVLQHALPVLRGLNIPATVYVATDHAADGESRRLLHFDEVEAAFRLTKRRTVHADFLDEPPRLLDSTAARVRCMKALKKKLKLSPQRPRLQAMLLDRLEVRADELLSYAAEHEKYRTMRWRELEELIGAGMSVGSHTRTHSTLSRLGPAEIEDEVQSSLADLRRNLDLESVSFAYPYGGPEHIGALAPAMVRQAGYTCALTTVPGSNDAATDLFMLRRVEFRDLL